MRAWGYGCDRRGEREFGTKRYRDFTYGGSRRSRLLCPGDSGGPGTLRANNQIALVHSAYYTASGIDIFADPVRYRAAILDWMRFYRLYP
jgi:hypothetical protein